MNPYGQPGGYPPAGQPGGYPPGQTQQQSYPPQQGGYGGYPPPSGSGGYPPPSGGAYPPAAGGYQQPGYTPPQQPQSFGGPGQPVKQFIQGGLAPGRMVTFNLTPGSNKFAINLRHSDGGDIAFHFNPRLPEQVVVRNTCVNGGWQNEERQQPHFPFRAGQPCTVLVLCEPTQFKVAVNGQHFLEYRLRTPSLQMIQLAEITEEFTNGSVMVQ